MRQEQFIQDFADYLQNQDTIDCPNPADYGMSLDQAREVCPDFSTLLSIDYLSGYGMEGEYV